jgi:3-oxoacyl-[acyl-carrier-protein] synthase III
MEEGLDWLASECSVVQWTRSSSENDEEQEDIWLFAAAAAAVVLEAMRVEFSFYCFNNGSERWRVVASLMADFNISISKFLTVI